MIGLDYITSQLVGVWRMALDRDDWRESLDRSIDGVFRSFWAIAFALPLALMQSFLLRRAAQKIDAEPYTAVAETPLGFLLAQNAVTFVFDWLVSIVALLVIARMLKAESGAGDIIVGYNWAMLAHTAAAIAPIALFATSGQEIIFVVASLPAVAFQLALLFGVIRRGFSATIPISIAIILMLTLVSMLSMRIVSGVFGIFSGG